MSTNSNRSQPSRSQPSRSQPSRSQSSAPPAKLSLGQLEALDDDAFVATLAGIFEHSPWVAEGALAGRPYASIEELHTAMTAVVAAAGRERQLELIRAHPDLAGKAAIAGEVTDHSRREQRGAGLDQLTAEEYARFHDLNRRYRERFGFPFVLAVKGHDKTSILDAFEQRLHNDPERERETALAEIAKIARFRLYDLLMGGP